MTIVDTIEHGVRVIGTVLTVGFLVIVVAILHAEWVIVQAIEDRDTPEPDDADWWKRGEEEPR